MKLLHGDCLEVLRTLPDNSVDAVVTDPPYGLSFMGKRWDYDVPSVEVWAECLRVLKPGGHLLAFAGTRTQHRMAVRIEDAGFEIRDMIAWVYGQGFPKSHNLKDEWAGWGTALKPALEPITVARKPLVGTVAENVLQHGTGGLNVDGCRVGTEENITIHGSKVSSKILERNRWRYACGQVNACESLQTDGQKLGRWPANLIHDGSDEVVAGFPVTTSGDFTRKASQTKKVNPSGWKESNRGDWKSKGDSGSAARFFYCAKASKADREGSTHPTMKPTDLMRYLCRLVTPPGGTVLDPFMGSGSTGKAAVLDGFDFIGIEREAEYMAIATARIDKVAREPRQGELKL